MSRQLVEQCLRDTLRSYHLSPSSQSLVQGLIHRLHHAELEIVVCGSASTGKTAILNALTKGKFGQSAPIHGTTQSPTNFTWQHPSGELQLTFVDTPCLEPNHSAQILEIAETADLLLCVTTPEITLSDRQFLLVMQHKPQIVVVNKVDLYPDCDRHSLLKQLADLGITEDQVVLVSALPLSERVRVEGRVFYETPSPRLQELENKLSQLIHQTGQQLICQNILGILAQVQKNSLLHSPPQLPRLRSWCCAVFVLEATCLLLSPLAGLDWLIGGLMQTSAMMRWSRFYPYTPLAVMPSFLGAIALNSLIISILWDYAQIAWVGISLLWLLQSLDRDLSEHSMAGDLLAQLQTKNQST